ncbi:MAG: FprA family A-type flavoprotein [Elusimicrobia bacterium]|nr:FprA family A-type flavoprotein [Elusimicrobiota bacterium]
MKPEKITEGVYSLRLNHFNRRLFDALVPLPDGTSYNAYLVRGSEKTALIDSGDPEKAEVLFDYLKDEKKIDYVVSLHAEQDHSGSIPQVLARHPEALVVTNPKCKDLLLTHLHLPAEKIIEIKDGETLSLGGKTLEFLYLPWVHWPETMGAYLREDKILFSCDFFGSHLATNELFSEERRVYEPMKRYFAEIMMPFRTNIKSHLERLSKYELSFIAPSHGPVHSNTKFVQDIHRDWAVGEPQNKVLVAYVSMHGSTLQLVNRLVSRLQEHGACVEKLNLEQIDEGRVAMALVDAATIVIGTPTVLAGPHPKAVYAAHLANLLRPKARFVSVIGSFGWGGRAAETIAGLIPNIKAELLKPVIVKGLPTGADLKQIDELAALIAEKHKTLPVCG